MSSGNATRKRTYLLLASMIFFSSLGNVFLSKGMKQVGEIVDFSPLALASVFLRTFTTGSIWLGIASLLLFFVSYLLVLTRADLSYVQPASAIGYALVALLGYLLLGESVSPKQWIGVLFICGGVALVTGTNPTTAARSNLCE
jgi:drug/metabolite transporter (DMT)-like permease